MTKAGGAQCGGAGGRRLAALRATHQPPTRAKKEKAEWENVEYAALADLQEHGRLQLVRVCAGEGRAGWGVARDAADREMQMRAPEHLHQRRRLILLHA